MYPYLLPIQYFQWTSDWIIPTIWDLTKHVVILVKFIIQVAGQYRRSQCLCSGFTDTHRYREENGSLGPSSGVTLSSVERASRPLDAGFISCDYFKNRHVHIWFPQRLHWKIKCCCQAIRSRHCLFVRNLTMRFEIVTVSTATSTKIKWQSLIYLWTEAMRLHGQKKNHQVGLFI